MSARRGNPDDASILIVDDTPANLRLLSEMLAAQGYAVRPAPDGALALAAVQAEPPDLILLDIRMPEMDGYEVCERLKADRQTRDIPVIFISALGETEDKLKAFAAGGVDYITKPFQIEEVRARVEAHLALRRLQQQLQTANRRFQEELNLAGQIQASFLPDHMPDIPGWQVAAALQPARETSGDFYDVIELPGGRLSVVVADVAGKGAGAALYMALTRTLLRTYASEYPDQPDRVLRVVNQRLLTDTRTSMFVTVFYGILDPGAAMLTYANAGHLPPYTLGAHTNRPLERLDWPGMALGVVDDAEWRAASHAVGPGDGVFIFTDGVTEAAGTDSGFFGTARLADVLAAQRASSAEKMVDAVVAAVRDYVGEAPAADDITCVALAREDSI